MPMYFILSGYIAHERKEGRIFFIKRKAYELLLPSVIFIGLMVPYSCGMNLIEAIKEITFWDGMIWNAPIWFLIVLFQVHFIFDAANLIKYSTQKKTVLAVLFLGLGYLIYKNLVWLPFGFQKTVIALGFYIIGNVLKEVNGMLRLKTKVVIVVVCCIIWFLTGCIFNTKVSMYAVSMGNYWYFIVSGICGSVMWFSIAYALRNVKVFRRWGQNTIFVVCTHYIGVAVCVKIANLLNLDGTIYFDILALIISFLAMVIYMPVCDWINKNMPILVGKKR